MNVENYRADNLLPRSTETVAIGGGPAGGATALTLAARGVSCLVVEAATEARNKIGEVIAPNITPILGKMGLEKLVARSSLHLPAYGNRFIWGGDKPEEKLFITQTNSRAWHIDRAYFEQKLAQKAIARGATWLAGYKFVQASYSGDRWQIELEYRGKIYPLEAKFLVDATGRDGKLGNSIGGQKRYYDRQMGLAGYFSLPTTDALPHLTHIEAVSGGWWYAAPLAGKRLVTVFMTDADLLEREMLDPQGYWQKIQATSLIKTLFPASSPPQLERGIIAKSARTSCLSSPVGENWLAVGDAAFACDPISSYGIGSALGGGYYAGNAIADYLARQPEALLAYRMLTESAFARYLVMLRHQYLQEQRWLDSPFWHRRHQTDFASSWIE